MMERLLEYLEVVPRYNFVITLIAAVVSIHWFMVKLRQWRLERIIRKLWERRNTQIRYRKTRNGTQGERL